MPLLSSLFTPGRRTLFAAFAAIAVFAAACGGGGDGDRIEISAVIVNSELVAGENRLMIGLLDQAANVEIVDADVALRIYKLDGEQQELRGEAVATPITLEKSYTHTHDDGTVETHEAGQSGVYVASIQLDEAGDWGIEITALVDGEEHGPLGVGFNVQPEGSTPAVGSVAPRSDSPTLADVDDVAEIDTSDPPIPGMHELSIADAVTSGRPTLVVFATPAFCLSRICGPTKDVVDGLFPDYRDRVNFVHVEPYDLERARSGEGLFPIAATEEWGLRSEPWVFIVDGDGTVAAKFEAVVTEAELQQALQTVLGG